ncbi:hypothetical protein GWI33_005770 [Rhynchophorus ferrugineus]|uniref:Uncharacterized protein n=1 Tax=Rhynchophorus ferrugineus TaxID=354439 RepID=A0A834IMP3_RHYFE|nr:hypothetical protein GWI33_005770 [Rhynchophorus ferrugineus]
MLPSSDIELQELQTSSENQRPYQIPVDSIRELDYKFKMLVSILLLSLTIEGPRVILLLVMIIKGQQFEKECYKPLAQENQLNALIAKLSATLQTTLMQTLDARSAQGNTTVCEKEKTFAAKCGNCGEPHTANFSGCSCRLANETPKTRSSKPPTTWPASPQTVAWENGGGRLLANNLANQQAKIWNPQSQLPSGFRATYSNFHDRERTLSPSDP